MTGSRGPLPKPAALRLLEGNAGKRSLDLTAGVNPMIRVPSIPKDLRPEGRKAWKRLSPHLEQLGLISELDAETFGVLCQAIGDLHCFDRSFNAKVNLLVQEGKEYADALVEASMMSAPSGYTQQSTLYSLIKGARAEYHRYAAHFGLSPALRGRVQPSNYVQPSLPGIDPKPENPVSGFARFCVVGR
jgi:P27 family predicted phage terminase small subunit